MVAFFDLFDYPLTLNEIWRYLGVKGELYEVLAELEKGIRAIDNRQGFYWLAGREAIVEKRFRRYNFADRKFKRALLMAKIFKLIPWIKLIAVGNLLGAHNLKDESDIDFFIVAENKRLWLTRFFCAGLTKILRLRPGQGGMKDKICLSFFVSEEALDLRGMMMEDAQDIYFIYWLAGLTPVYDRGGVYEKLIAANGWLNETLPNWSVKISSNRRNVGLPTGQAGAPAAQFYHDLVDLFLGGLEPQLRRWQIKILPPALKSIVNLDSRVVASEQVIKLHANDRRMEYGERYLRKLKNLDPGSSPG